MSSISYNMNVAKTLQYRSSIRDSESEKQPQEVYNLDSPVGCVVGNKGNSFVLNAVPTSSKRNAPENDGTSDSVESDDLHTPPSKRQA